MKNEINEKKKQLYDMWRAIKEKLEMLSSEADKS